MRRLYVEVFQDSIKELGCERWIIIRQKFFGIAKSQNPVVHNEPYRLLTLLRLAGHRYHITAEEICYREYEAVTSRSNSFQLGNDVINEQEIIQLVSDDVLNGSFEVLLRLFHQATFDARLNKKVDVILELGSVVL